MPHNRTLPLFQPVSHNRSKRNKIILILFFVFGIIVIFNYFTLFSRPKNIVPESLEDGRILYRGIRKEGKQNELKYVWEKEPLGSKKCHVIDTSIHVIREKTKFDYVGLPTSGVDREFSAPLCLDIDPNFEPRINIIYHDVAEFRKGLSAGPQAILNVAFAAHKVGFKARIIDLLNTNKNPNEIPKQWDLSKHLNFDNFQGYFDKIEVFLGRDRKQKLRVSPDDIFVAGYWKTGFAAHQAMKDLGRKSMLYSVNDYEPLFFPAGSESAASLQTLIYPHYTITNSPIMTKFLERRKLDLEPSDIITIKHPIPEIFLEEEEIRKRVLNSNVRRVLVYARSKARNGFDIIADAIRIVNNDGYFKNGRQWEFHGVGESNFQGTLGKDITFHNLGSMSHEEYASKLSQYDLGISLILTPNINFAQLDFAAAGLITIVNTFEDIKTQTDYDEIGKGMFIAVPPTVDGVVQGIKDGIRKVEKLNTRLIGANLNWPNSFDEAWNESNQRKFKEIIHKAQFSNYIN